MHQAPREKKANEEEDKKPAKSKPSTQKIMFMIVKASSSADANDGNLMSQSMSWNLFIYKTF
jgi:hypothetical protein